MINRLKRKLILLGVIILSFNKLFGQNLNRIYLEEYKYTLVYDGKGINAFSAKISGDRTIIIHLLSRKGQMNVECYDKDLVLIEKGAYSNSLDLLKKYVDLVTFDDRYPGNHKAAIGVYSYYQPLRNGIWSFFDKRKKMYMKKNYIKGILIDSLVVK